MVKNNFYALSLLFILSSALTAKDCDRGSRPQTKSQECVECSIEQCPTECTECPMRKIEDAQAFAITFKIEKNDEGSWHTIADSIFNLISKTDCGCDQKSDINAVICHVKELIEFARLRDLHGSIGLSAFENVVAHEETKNVGIPALDLEKILAGNNVAITFRVEKGATPSEAWDVVVKMIQNFIADCQACEAEEAECSTYECLENIAAIVGQAENIKGSLSIEVIN